MTDTALFWNLATLGVLALGGPLVGLAVYRSWHRFGLVLATLLAAWTGAAAAAGPMSFGSWSCAGLALGYLAYALMRRRSDSLVRLYRSVAGFGARFGRMSVVASVFGSTLLWAAVFGTAGPLLATALAAHIDRASNAPDAFSGMPAVSPIQFVSWDRVAHTDKGLAIPLGEVHWSQAEVDALREKEKVHGQTYALKLLRTALPDPTSDCHGWVFTGGQFWVMSTAVDDILKDNGYQPVTAPRAGDVIVYRRSPDTVPTHSGLVHTVDDGTILIESKWGNLGRYLHAPADQPFGQTWTYYRSTRQGHHLIIESDSHRSQ